MLVVVLAWVSLGVVNGDCDGSNLRGEFGCEQREEDLVLRAAMVVVRL